MCCSQRHPKQTTPIGPNDHRCHLWPCQRRSGAVGAVAVGLGQRVPTSQGPLAVGVPAADRGLVGLGELAGLLAPDRDREADRPLAVRAANDALAGATHQAALPLPRLATRPALTLRRCATSSRSSSISRYSTAFSARRASSSSWSASRSRSARRRARTASGSL